MRARFQVVAAIALAGAVSPPIAAQQKAATPQRVEVCNLLPKAEVRKHLPWKAMFDQMALEEEAIGTTGSSCSYPTVQVQVLMFTRSFLDAARQSATLETIPGLGDEAYFRNNKDMFAEVFVRVGQRLLTLQADADDNVAAVKPKVIGLAREYVAKLR